MGCCNDVYFTLLSGEMGELRAAIEVLRNFLLMKFCFVLWV